MKIIVCVKQVPDSAAKVVVDEGTVTWGDAPLVINPWDEYAVEASLQTAKDLGGSVTAISMGKEGEREALKHALAMGCDEAVHVSDPALGGADNIAAAKVMAAAIKHVGDVNLVIFGKQAIDNDTGMMASQVARIMGWPALTLLSTINDVDLDAGTIKVRRATEEGRQTVEGKLPAVISVTKDYGEPRYPSFMGIRKAARADIPVWSLAEIGIEAPESVVSWPEVMNPPTSEMATEIITGDSPQDIAQNLAEKILAEKVL